MLQQLLNLKDHEVRKIVTTLPSVLSCSITDNIEPTLKFLQNELAINDSELSDVIVKQPQLLGLSIERNLKPTLHFYLKSIEIVRDFYQNPKIHLDNLYHDGFTFPTKEDFKWEMLFGLRRSDLIIYWVFEGWDFKSMYSAD